ncbi:MAG: hypothetical protein CBC12_13635 [Candidatus Puniceispirillum sp. TMED52]|nr:hypothetical protein [SAR116 cluster bacterium]OUU44139.1 MAG: hypothetical protein CBC12_13635 [Candidatus Puniceispirillum sp. TMED52]|tara:strand:- start:5 stop:1408 length:1404 start_codon:yes stop_codon:yes gene_type:complete
MKIEIKTNTPVKLVVEDKKSGDLRVNSEYQRGLTWKEHQKQMFIDSLFRGYKAPAFYFHKKIKGNYDNISIEIIDGQQRIDALASYIDGAFPLLDPNANGAFKFPNFSEEIICPWAGKRFDELTDELKKELLDHELVIYEITTNDDNQVRDLFIRLQAGTPLTPQDKRDAWPGNFTDFVLTIGGKQANHSRWYGLDLFKPNRCAKAKESERRQLAAQAFMLYWNKTCGKKFCDIKSRNLDEFYHEQIGFNKNCSEASEFKAICDEVSRALDGHPKLVGHHLLHLILLVADLRSDFTSGWQNRLGDALGTFKSNCTIAKEANKANEESDLQEYYTEYVQWTSRSSDISGNIQRRHIFFYEKMIEILNVKRKDDNRTFSSSDRQKIFYRDNRLCQYCEMEKESNETAYSHRISWEDAEIHHVEQHSHGGQTILANGALMHKDCHPKAMRKVEEFAEWWKSRKRASHALD